MLINIILKKNKKLKIHKVAYHYKKASVCSWLDNYFYFFKSKN
jgi:hypothetical protein